MNPERAPESPAAKTGIFYVLARSLRGEATGAPSMRLLASLGLAVAALVLVAVPTASAAPFVFQKGQTEALSAGVPGGGFVEPFSLTFDSAGNLYVADPRGDEETGVIDKFDDENVFKVQLGGAVFPDRFLRGIAVNDETGHIYAGDQEAFAEPPAASLYALDAVGAELSHWHGDEPPAGPFGPGYVAVAVDNSPSASHDDIYVGVPRPGSGEVDVFESQEGDAREGKFLRTLEAPPEGFSEGGFAIAVDGSSGQVYVVNNDHKEVDRFSPAGVYETRITGPAPGTPFAEPVAVAVNAANGHVFVVDHGAGAGGGADFVDEFNSAGQLVNQITETGPNEPITRAVGVAVQETGPHAGALYVADAGAKRIDVFAEEQPGAPIIETEGVKGVGNKAATFLGEVNPKGSTTEYHFEYGPCSPSTSCAASPYTLRTPATDATVPGEGFAAQPTESLTVTGLSAETTYHFRLVAHNVNGVITGEERVFTTQRPATAGLLPDDRQWQLVSPPDKHGGTVFGAAGGEDGFAQAAADGSAVTYLDGAPIEGSPPGYDPGGQALSIRGSAGWDSRQLGITHKRAVGSSTGAAPPYRFFDEDLGTAVLQPYGLFNPALSPAGSEQTPYLQKLGSCMAFCFTPIATGKEGFANVPPGTRFGEEAACEESSDTTTISVVCGPIFEGATPDAGNVILRSAAPLVPTAPANELYEWTAGHQLALVSILPPNEAGDELPAPAGAIGAEQPLLGYNYLPGTDGGNARRAISDDGARIYFESDKTLYLRDTVLGKSLQIDAPDADCTECEGQGGAGVFQIASANGSRVFFTDARHLTEDSGASAESPDLYECRILVSDTGRLSCQLADLTPVEGGQGANVQGDVLGASEDGSTVYFVADGTLGVPGAQRGTCTNPSESSGGQPAGALCNLYERRDGEGTRLVTTLSGGDSKVWSRRAHSTSPARVSPNGHWLAFLSERSLTGYDNLDALAGNPDAEAFLYHDNGDGRLLCASCNPSGSRPIGARYDSLTTGENESLPAGRGEWTTTGFVSALFVRTLGLGKNQPSYQPRYLSDSGRLYFNSLDALVPSDTNAVGDVYQYEPADVGACATSTPTYSPVQGGCIDLISSGTSPQASAFLDASESGDDVFFFTFSRLAPQDVDSRRDIYDAHVCSATAPCFPPPPPSAPACEGDACQQPAVPPNHPTPGTALLNGPGNIAECPKGKKLSKGKCVKQKKHKAKKKKHHKKKGGGKNTHRRASSNRGGQK